MAITATIALSSSSIVAEQKTVATCTVTNSGGSAVNVTAINPTVTPSGATPQSVSVAVGQPPLLPGMPTSVAASGGTTKFSWDVVPHAPSSGYGSAEPASQIYDVGALINTSDGSLTSATTSALTVTNPGH